MFQVRDGQQKRQSEQLAHDAMSALNERPSKSRGADDLARERHQTLMALLDYEGDRQGEERVQMQIDEDYNDHMQWRQEDAAALIARGQAPIVFNEGRQTIDWVAGTERRMRKDYKILPREPNDEQAAEVKTKLVKFTDDVNSTAWARSRAFKQAAIAGLSWLEEGVNPDPEQELIYSGWEDWRNVYRDSHSRALDYNTDARYLFRQRTVDLDYALALLPGSRETLIAASGEYEAQPDDDIWYLGERLTGAADTEWQSASRLGARSAYMMQGGYFDSSARQSVRLIETWYRVPERVKVFADGRMQGRVVNPSDPMQQGLIDKAEMYESVKFRMRLMLSTKDAPCLDMPSPFRHQRFLLVPVWAYRRSRDGMAYGIWRGMRDIQDDYNKRRSKALWALSVNRIVAEKSAVDDLEDLRQEAARPDGIILKNAGKELSIDHNVPDYQGNLAMANADLVSLRNVGGVTNENLGRDTNASSGKAIGLKQDQGSLTTSELFDNLLLAIKQAGKLRLSHIEQFYTGEKVVRIVGEAKPIEWLEVNRLDPATGQVLNDVTAREADFVVDTQDWRSSLAQSQLEELFQLLGQIATFAPQAVLNVLDLVVESTEVKDKAEWVTRIRKLNGQRDPTKPMTPEEQQAEIDQAEKMNAQEQMAIETAKATLQKLQGEVSLTAAQIKKLDVDGVLRKVEAMYSALQAAQIVATVPQVTPAADEIARSAGLSDENPGDIPQPDVAPQDATQPSGAINPAGALDGAQAGIETARGADNMISQPATGEDSHGNVY